MSEVGIPAISGSRVLGAAARCALSMAVVGLGIFFAFDGVSRDSLMRGVSAIGGAALASFGYGVTLWAARRRLRDDAGVGGRRDLIAGVLAIVILFGLSTLTQGAAPFAIGAMCVLSGFLSAVAMYFPWIQRPATSEKTASTAER